MFQVFQLTTLVIRGPPTFGGNFSLRLNQVAINEEEVRDVLLCVQDFARSPHFSQGSFFSESGLTMLSESVAIADSITPNPVHAPSRVVESVSASQVNTDLCASWDWVVLRCCAAEDTIERCYHVDTPRKETASRPGLRISSVVEEGRVEYVPVAAPALGLRGPSRIRSSSSKRKRKISRSPVK